MPFVYRMTFRKVPARVLKMIGMSGKTRDVKYVGSRFRKKGCHPNQMNETHKDYYRSSSKFVHKLIDMGYKPEIEILKVFRMRKNALPYETRVLENVDAKNNPDYINRSNGSHLTIAAVSEGGKRHAELYGSSIFCW